MTLSNLLLQPMGPKAGTAGTTAPSQPDPAAAAGGSAPGFQSQIWVMIPMVAVVAFMLFSSRNQRKREEETRAKLKKGDKVVSQSGLIGELIDMDERIAKVKIAPGTTVQMLLSTISPLDSAPTSSAADNEKKLSDLKDAKAAAEKKG